MPYSETNKSLSPGVILTHRGAIDDTGDTDVLSDLVSAALSADTCDGSHSFTRTRARARGRRRFNREMIPERDKTRRTLASARLVPLGRIDVVDVVVVVMIVRSSSSASSSAATATKLKPKPKTRF